MLEHTDDVLVNILRLHIKIHLKILYSLMILDRTDLVPV